MQIINKKCPYCSAIFKVKSALESHLQTKHVDKQMVNIDAIPEINFVQKEPHFSMQMPTIAEISNVNVGQQMSVDFWKTKMMQQPQTSQFFGNQKRMSDFSESEISFTDSNNDELADEDYDMDNFNDDSNHVDDFQATAVQPGDLSKSKRHRTHVNRVQKSILRKIFDDVKSPSMIDCENIGREIGLFKRVVQVSELQKAASQFLIMILYRFGFKMPERTTKNVINSQLMSSNIFPNAIRLSANTAQTTAR